MLVKPGSCSLHLHGEFMLTDKCHFINISESQSMCVHAHTHSGSHSHCANSRCNKVSPIWYVAHVRNVRSAIYTKILSISSLGTKMDTQRIHQRDSARFLPHSQQQQALHLSAGMMQPAWNRASAITPDGWGEHHFFFLPPWFPWLKLSTISRRIASPKSKLQFTSQSCPVPSLDSSWILSTSLLSLTWWDKPKPALALKWLSNKYGIIYVLNITLFLYNL